MPFIAPVPAAHDAVTLDTLRHHRRVLVVSARAGDPRLTLQRAALDGWRQGAADRDVSMIQIAGDTVTGVADAAADVRRRLRLTAGTFAVVLVGKDGHLALKADHPLSADELRASADATPMRRAGLR